MGVSMSNISLVIQGPLLSKGKTGAGDDRVVEFDCRENIDEIARKYKDHFRYIVLCTWNNDVFADYENPAVIKLLLDENFNEGEDLYHSSARQDAKEKEIRYSSPDKANFNKERQFYSSYKGCEYLEKLGYSGFVLKIRTDQIFNFSPLKEFSEYPDVRESDKIFIPCLREKRGHKVRPLIFINDWYFFGKVNVLKEFFRCQLDPDSEKTQSVHTDVLYRYLYVKLKDNLDDDPIYFYVKTMNRVFQRHSDIIEVAFKNYFCPLPRSFLETVKWRGFNYLENFERKDIFILYEDWITNNYKDAYIREIQNMSKVPINALNAAYAIDLNSYCSNHDNVLYKLYRQKQINKIMTVIGYVYCKLYTILM